jgi:ABC-type transport system involved in multi-copper enzyme maturation permease subunit
METLIKLLREYLELRLTVTELQVKKMVTSLLARFLILVALLVVFATALLISSVGLGWWLATRVGWGIWGYLAVGGGYFLLGLLLYFRREAVESSLREQMLHHADALNDKQPFSTLPNDDRNRTRTKEGSPS